MVYFAFMAAWLNIFMLIGYSRGLQVVLAGVALFMGGLNTKDFFAFKKGLSLGISDSAKAGIQGRIRRILRAENLLAALIGVAVLAVLVNFVELLCTAGLPAIYTQILISRELSTGEYYGYLTLYNLAYIADDSVMVGIAVVTLGRRKLQERGGRVLKLISGLVMLALGVLLLVKPQWLSPF
jgi:hypothetical protein